jgi:hypothetical protein
VHPAFAENSVTSGWKLIAVWGRPSASRFTNLEVFTVSAARTNDLDPGEMRTVEVSGKKILLLRTFDDQSTSGTP